MKRVIKFEYKGGTKIGYADEQGVFAFGDDVASIGQAMSDLEKASADATLVSASIEDVSLLAPIDDDARVFAVAQNYTPHAKEVSGTAAPPSPIIFLKTVSSLVGPTEDISPPGITKFLDYEAEMALVIGSSGAEIAAESALDHIAGVTCFNDVTGRDLQPAKFGDGTIIDWFSAKCLEKSSPIGPWIVPTKELDGEVDALRVSCRVNGETVQEDLTSNMVNSCSDLIEFISHRVALKPGDVIATGTPGGVGKARGVRLETGDVVEVSVEGVGNLANRVSLGRDY